MSEEKTENPTASGFPVRTRSINRDEDRPSSEQLMISI